MRKWLQSLFHQWEYGTVNGEPARRHRRSGAVQFVLWKAGEQGHAVDYWHDFHSFWWPSFTPDSSSQPSALNAQLSS